jgi:hypothetical protein
MLMQVVFMLLFLIPAGGRAPNDILLWHVGRQEQQQQQQQQQQQLGERSCAAAACRSRKGKVAQLPNLVQCHQERLW